MRLLFMHFPSEALTIVPDAKECTCTDEYYIVQCSNSTGYFPCSDYLFLGIDSDNLL